MNRSSIQWWKFQLHSTGTPLTYSASGIVYDASASSPWWYYMPSLAVNWANVMVVGFSGSSATNYISALYTGRTADGAMILPPTLIQSGSGYYGWSSRRWGDYSYTIVDPADNQTFWTVQSYATSTGYNWADWLISIKPAP